MSPSNRFVTEGVHPKSTKLGASRASKPSPLNATSKALAAELDILIVDSHPLVRLGLRTILENIDHVNVSEARFLGDEIETIDPRMNNKPDMLILDSMLSGKAASHALGCCRKHYLDIPIVLFSASPTPELARDVFRLGASGVIPTGIDPCLIPHALRIVVGKGRYVPYEVLEGESKTPAPTASQILAKSTALHAELPSLTGRQQQIFDLMAQGLSNKEISRRLQISLGTTKNHVARILQQFGVNNRVRAVSTLLAINEEKE
ncbi:LuxR family two component transcriptional regulator [Azonexus fungiphilus]|uniref:LuxR family two component transcriptional regulator n=1 Tax=Azonexus fungiphilus TaxID=146940 RepID=A0A495WNQ3_9RHOO|nr:response regulator transcription factor [Azonexus fungiphilus]RKT62947.1 LuxR family two component transcriptional regulator [Azonexus fungiphilus]